MEFYHVEGWLKAVSFADRLASFLIFVFLTIITFGLYPLYFIVTTKREEVALLRQINEKLDRKL